MPLNVSTYLVSDVLNEVRRTFGDESSVQITDIDIIRWINAAQREILAKNKVLKAVGTTAITQGVSEYSLTGLNVYQIQSIHYQGQKLEYRSFQDAEEYILSDDPSKTTSGSPILWYEWGGTINLWPVPDTTDPAGLKVYYIKEPTRLSSTNTAQVLDVPDIYFENVLQFVLAKAYELDEDQENSQYKLAQFTSRIEGIAGQEQSPEQDTYPRISIREEDM